MDVLPLGVNLPSTFTLTTGIIPGVNKLFEAFSRRFVQINHEVKDLKKENHKLVAENDQPRSKIDEMEKTIEGLKKKKNRTKKPRSYNTREYKGYPHVKRQSTPPPYASTIHHAAHKIIDHKFCPVCGEPLAESLSSYMRYGEAIIDGR